MDGPLSPAGWLRGIKLAFQNIPSTGYAETCDTIDPRSWGQITFDGRCWFYPRRDCPGYRPGGRCGRIGKEIPEMALYRITIEKAETQEDGRVKAWHEAVTITASTSYTLADDLQEWVREEIDPGAEIDYPGESEGNRETQGTMVPSDWECDTHTDYLACMRAPAHYMRD